VRCTAAARQRPAAAGINRQETAEQQREQLRRRSGRQAGWHLPLRLRAWEGERTETRGLCQWCWCSQTHGTVSCPLRNGLVFGTGRRKETVSTEYGPHQWPWLGQSVVTWSVSVRRGVTAKGRAQPEAEAGPELLASSIAGLQQGWWGHLGRFAMADGEMLMLPCGFLATPCSTISYSLRLFHQLWLSCANGP